MDSEKKQARSFRHRLKKAYDQTTLAGQFLAQQKFGAGVAFKKPDQEYLQDARALAYHTPDAIYAGNDVSPRTLLHELRHDWQMKTLGRRTWKDFGDSHYPERSILFSGVIEGDATFVDNFGCMNATYIKELNSSTLFLAAAQSNQGASNHNNYMNDIGHVSFLGTIKTDKLSVLHEAWSAVEKGMAAVQLPLHIVRVKKSKDDGQPLSKDEHEITEFLMDKLCRLPDGTNYVFDGQASVKQYELVETTGKMFLDHQTRNDIGLFRRISQTNVRAVNLVTGITRGLQNLGF